MIISSLFHTKFETTLNYVISTHFPKQTGLTPAGLLLPNGVFLGSYTQGPTGDAVSYCTSAMPSPHVETFAFLSHAVYNVPIFGIQMRMIALGNGTQLREAPGFLPGFLGSCPSFATDLYAFRG